MQSSQESFRIVLNLPSKFLSPNRPPRSIRGRYAKAAIVKKYRAEAKRATEACGLSGDPWENAEVEVFFYHKQNRRRDEANFIGMLKPAYDGVVGAGAIKDDSRKHLHTRDCHFLIDKDYPRVELLFTRV